MRILHALRVEPRAGFASLGTSIGRSEAAVARRYRRLERDGIVRVVGVVDTGALGRSRWWVRMRCRPEAVSGIAAALAARDDVPWVAVTGSGELTCFVAARSHEQRDDLLAVRLPRTRAVLELDSAMVLHRFGAAAGPAEAGSAAGQDPVRLTAQDDALLAALAVDGRLALADLARASGLTAGRAGRRLQALQSRGVLGIGLETADAAFGIRAPAVVRVRAHPARLRSAGEALARLPEAASVDATTGERNLHVVLRCRDLEHLFAVVTDGIGAVDGVQDAAVSPLLEQVAQAGLRLDDGAFVPPTPTARRTGTTGSPAP